MSEAPRTDAALTANTDVASLADAMMMLSRKLERENATLQKELADSESMKQVYLADTERLKEQLAEARERIARWQNDAILAHKNEGRATLKAEVERLQTKITEANDFIAQNLCEGDVGFDLSLDCDDTDKLCKILDDTAALASNDEG